MSDLKPGDLVVRVMGNLQGLCRGNVYPTVGHVYTVREVLLYPFDVGGLCPALRLEEIRNPITHWDSGDISEVAFGLVTFRPVSRKSTELFRELVENPKQPVKA